jgi:hypothetical protein
METNYYEPTEEEVDALDHAGMMAAYAQLKPIENKDLAYKDGLKSCLSAFSAASKECRKKSKELLATKEGFTDILYYPNLTVIACTAMVNQISGFDPKDSSGSSVGGERIAFMIRASKAMDAMSDLRICFEDDTDGFGTHFAEDVISYSEKFED